MYKDMTYEYILARMMERVKAKHPNLDSREGSIIFDALAGAAIELAIAYDELTNVLAESFIKTASREYKLIGCSDMGMDISMFEAHAGTFKGEFNVKVPIGSRWNYDLYNYEVIEYLGMNGKYHTYSLLCETLGSAPNELTGSLTCITNIPSGLTYAELTECLIEGENEKSDEEINEAYEEFVNSSSEDGNVNQYKRWCNEYDGIGNSKIMPLWNGANTVKVSILSASNRAATSELIDAFQEYLDPGSNGMGDGVAPIGAFVTVSTATEVPIDITADITMSGGYNDTSVIDTAITEYFQSVAYEKTMIGYMNIGSIIINTEGVESVSNLTINGGNSDITLGGEEIPILGVTDWKVI